MKLSKCKRFVDFTPTNYDLEGWTYNFINGYPDEFSLFNGEKIFGGIGVCNTDTC